MSQFAPLVEKDNPANPKDIAYACVFWVDHLCMIKDDLGPIEKLLESFIDQHFCHWFEAMSLLKRFSLTIILLDQLLDWLPSTRKRLLTVVCYWWRFSREYEIGIIEWPMQVYSEEILREFQAIEAQEPLVS